MFTRLSTSCRRSSRLVNGIDPAEGLAKRECYKAKASQIFSATAVSQLPGTSKTLRFSYFSKLDSSIDAVNRICLRSSSSCAIFVAFFKVTALLVTDN